MNLKIPLLLLLGCTAVTVSAQNDAEKRNLVKALEFAATPNSLPQNQVTLTENTSEPVDSRRKKISAKDSRLSYFNVRSIMDAPVGGYVRGVSADFGNPNKSAPRANICSIDFVFSGSQFNFYLYNMDPALKQDDIYLEVNGKLSTADGLSMSSGPGMQLHSVSVNFDQSIMNQHIRLIIPGFWAFGGLLVNQSSDISAYVPDNNSRVVVFGDSYVAGTGADNQLVNFYPYYLGKLLGWNNTIISGVGSTGYLNPGRNRLIYHQRINDIISAKPDAVVISGGLNDLKFASAQDVGNEALSFYKDLRSALPNCKIIVVGPFYPHSTNYPAAYRDAIKSAAENVPGISFIDPSDLKYDDMLAADHVHPSPAGHKYLAIQLAERIKKAILTN